MATSGDAGSNANSADTHSAGTRSGDRLAPVTQLFASPEDDRPSAEKTGAEKTGVQKAEIEKAGVERAGQKQLDRSARRAENVSLNGLTRRNMSRWEIEKLLTSRDLDEDVIAAEVARLEGVGLIDDAALAETLVRTQRDRKGLGHQALVAELRRRHIDQEIIDAAVNTDGDEDDEQQRANEVAIKRAGQLSSYDLETAKRRLTAFLMRKGYSSSIVRTAAAAALDERSNNGRSGGVRFR